MFKSKKLIKGALLIALGAVIATPFTTTDAKSIRTSTGTMPVVYWNNITSFHYLDNSSTLKNLWYTYSVGAGAQEPGTYAIYEANAAENNNLMRGIEIYANADAYKQHTNSSSYMTYLTQRIAITQSALSNQVTPLVLESKESGTATSVYTADVTLNESQTSKYNDLTDTEYTRAVDNVPGVLAAFSVANAIYPNQIHNMILFTDDNAKASYLASTEYQNYLSQIKTGNMIQSETIQTNQPTNIAITGKALHDHDKKATNSKDEKAKKAKNTKTKKVKQTKQTPIKTTTTAQTTTNNTTDSTALGSWQPIHLLSTSTASNQLVTK